MVQPVQSPDVALVAAMGGGIVAGLLLDRWAGLAPRIVVGVLVFIAGWIMVREMFPLMLAGAVLLSPWPYTRTSR